MRRLCILLLPAAFHLSALSALSAAPALPQAVPVTGEILISVSDQTSRLRPDVAADRAGRFVVVWREIEEQDGGIAGRRVSAGGVPEGPGFVVAPREERLNTTNPRVVCRADGGFLAAWGEAAFPRQGCARARLFEAQTEAGDAFDLGPCASAPGRAPVVSLGGLRDGRVTAAWESGQASAPAAIDVLVRPLSALDEAPGEAVRVDAGRGEDGSETAPAVAVDGLGRAFVVWAQADAGALFGRLFDAAGQPLGAPFRVDAGIGIPLEAAVAAAPGGRFVAVWSAYLGGGDRFAILAQRFDASGRKQGPLLVVSPASSPAREHHDPDVATDAAGNFLVVWGATRVDGFGTGVLGRFFTRKGEPLGEPFRINRTLRGSQGHPAVASTRAGRFLVVWDSQRNAAGRGSIVGRLYETPRPVVP
jgi:hypothetical protein